MLQALFARVLGTSLSLAPLLALLLLAGPLLRERFAARAGHLLWAVAAVRLLLPLPLLAGVGLRVPAGGAVAAGGDGAAVAAAFARAGERFGPLLDGGAAAAQGGGLTWLGAAALLWLAGAAVYLAVNAAGYIHTGRSIKRWSRPVTDKAALRVFEEVSAELGAGRVELVRSTAVNSPLLIGFFRPRVVLPDAEPEECALRCVLRHELTHLRRGDLWYKLLLLAAGAMHWFNPLVWAMARRAEADMELACDADVLAQGGVTRREYGMSVLAFVRAPEMRRVPLSTCMCAGQKQVRQRFAGIVDLRKKRRGTPLVLIAAAVAALLGTLIGCGVERAEPAPPAAAAEPSIEASGEAAAQTAPADAPAGTAGQADSGFSMELTRFVAGAGYGEGALMWPAPGFYELSAAYGLRHGGSDFHTGIDIAGEEMYGTPVFAADGGTVTYVNRDYTSGVGYGIYMIVDHGGGVQTLYAHLSEATAEAGDSVVRGEMIGAVGATGWAEEPHLHFEVRENGAHTDPEPYLNPEAGTRPAARGDSDWEQYRPQQDSDWEEYQPGE